MLVHIKQPVEGQFFRLQHKQLLTNTLTIHQTTYTTIKVSSKFLVNNFLLFLTLYDF